MSGNNYLGTDCCTPSDTQTQPAADCCMRPAGQSGAVEEIRSHEVSPEVEDLRAAGFRLLLEQSRPIEHHEWAEAASIDPDDLDQVLKDHWGRVEVDEQGRLIGIAGLTIRPTNHELNVNGSQHWTWCALDAVGILGALEATGTVQSIDPSTNDHVSLVFDKGQAQSDATIFVLSGYDGGDIRGEWCPLVNFFNNRLDAHRWVANNQLQGDILTVQEVAGQAADLWRVVAEREMLTSPEIDTE